MSIYFAKYSLLYLNVTTEYEIEIVDGFLSSRLFALAFLYDLEHEKCHINHTK